MLLYLRISAICWSNFFVCINCKEVVEYLPQNHISNDSADCPIFLTFPLPLSKATEFKFNTVKNRLSAAVRLLRLWVRIPPGAWMSVCCECCVLSGSGLCDELITRPEQSDRLWCVQWVWSRNLVNEETLARLGLLG